MYTLQDAVHRKLRKLAYSIELHDSDSLVVSYDDDKVTIALCPMYTTHSKVAFQFVKSTSVLVPTVLLHMVRYGVKETARVIAETFTGSYKPKGVQIG